MNEYRDGRFDLGPSRKESEKISVEEYARRFSGFGGHLTASEEAQPIAASLNSLHDLSCEALKAVSRLEERLSPVLHEPQPEKEANGCSPVATCSLHDELLSVSRRVEEAISRVNRLMARLAL